MNTLLELPLRQPEDALVARRQLLRISELLQYSRVDQTRIATAASEVARACLETAHATLRVAVAFEEPVGRLRIKASTTSELETSTFAPVVPRLVDNFSIEPSDEGCCVVLEKRLPAHITAAVLPELRSALGRAVRVDRTHELDERQAELLVLLHDLEQRQRELQAANRELEDTNRGVLALYAELDERADQLKRANQLKGQFLSYLSHEFRTPLNSMVMLSRMLLDEMAGPITGEQGTQIRLLRKSAEELLEMVNDLLDLAKIDAGKIDLHADVVDVPEFFSALRGMFRPLALSSHVDLVIENPLTVSELRTDSGKLAQILRNLISNAIKFTNRGQVRVSAWRDGTHVCFVVKDTGIGIPEDAQGRIFGEFEQVPTALHRRVRGTGLGLPLSQRLAHLLGGEITLVSVVGVGSTFTARLPLVAPFATDAALATAEAETGAAPVQSGSPPPDLTGRRILVIDDDGTSRYLVSALLRPLGAVMLEAENGLVGIESARADRPELILLDLRMPGMDGQEVLAGLRAQPATQSIPVIIYTSKRLQESELAELQAAAAGVVVKNPDHQEVLIAAVRSALRLDPN